MRHFKSVLLLVIAGVLTLTLAACGKSATKQSSAKKQTLNLSTTAPLDTIDISKSSGYGQTGNVF